MLSVVSIFNFRICRKFFCTQDSDLCKVRFHGLMGQYKQNSRKKFFVFLLLIFCIKVFNSFNHAKSMITKKVIFDALNNNNKQPS
jgi:hypothetical protein